MQQSVLLYKKYIKMKQVTVLTVAFHKAAVFFMPDFFLYPKIRGGEIVPMEKSKNLKEEIMKITLNESEAEKLLRLFLQEFHKLQETERMERCQYQRKAIRKAMERGAAFGRPRKKPPENFPLICDRFLNGDLKAPDAAMLSGMALSTFYRKLNEYRGIKKGRKGKE